MNLRLPAIGTRGEARPLTGHMVLAMLIGFFGLVIAVNLVMVREAITTFGGVDTPSSYQAGLNFKAEEAAAAAQDALHWQVDTKVVPDADGARVTVDIREATGAPVHGVAVTATLAHPIDERRDVVVVMNEAMPGLYSGKATAEAGQWILDIEVARDGRRVFRSRNRVVVP
jgi:nitrogen fixation protein FixH